jgi:hypothetical protein
VNLRESAASAVICAKFFLAVPACAQAWTDAPGATMPKALSVFIVFIRGFKFFLLTTRPNVSPADF